MFLSWLPKEPIKVTDFKKDHELHNVEVVNGINLEITKYKLDDGELVNKAIPVPCPVLFYMHGDTLMVMWWPKGTKLHGHVFKYCNHGYFPCSCEEE
jgi:hypothetical protein